MSGLRKYSFTFTTNQLRKIATAFKKKTPAILHISYDNLINGKHDIILCPENVTKVEKAIRLKKGLRLVLSCNELKNIKQGGFLPLLFAGLGALGALTGGASAIANSVINKQQREKELAELKRHNKAMEGKGLQKRKKFKKK